MHILKGKVLIKTYKLNNKSLIISNRRRNILKVSMRTEVSKKFSQIRILTNFMSIFTLRKTHWIKLGSQLLGMCISMWVCAPSCNGIYMCVFAHLHEFNLKDNFCIKFELPSLFYIIFILIFSFSFSEKTPVKSGKFSKTSSSQAHQNDSFYLHWCLLPFNL